MSSGSARDSSVEVNQTLTMRLEATFCFTATRESVSEITNQKDISNIRDAQISAIDMISLNTNNSQRDAVIYQEECHDTTEPEDHNASSPDSSKAVFYDALETIIAEENYGAAPSNAPLRTGYTMVAAEDDCAKLKIDSNREVFKRHSADTGESEAVICRQSRGDRICSAVNYAVHLLLKIYLVTMNALAADSCSKKITKEAVTHPNFVHITTGDPSALKTLAHFVKPDHSQPITKEIFEIDKQDYVIANYDDAIDTEKHTRTHKHNSLGIITPRRGSTSKCNGALETKITHTSLLVPSPAIGPSLLQTKNRTTARNYNAISFKISFKIPKIPCKIFTRHSRSVFTNRTTLQTKNRRPLKQTDQFTSKEVGDVVINYHYHMAK